MDGSTGLRTNLGISLGIPFRPVVGQGIGDERSGWGRVMMGGGVGWLSSGTTVNLADFHDWRLQLLFCCVRLHSAQWVRFSLLFSSFFLPFFGGRSREVLGALPWVRVRRTGPMGGGGVDAGDC